MMADDRTKPPPGMDVTPKGYSTEARPRHVAEVDTCEGSYERVVEDCWSVADALRREGFMMALDAVRNIGDHSYHPRTVRKVADRAESKAPGEPTP
jgi:hypothetical protein